ncbi:MAG TPA: hypothetical protein V6D19_05900 [Stenomitos sp.]
MNQILPLTLISLIGFAFVASAQVPIMLGLDRNGDYFSNENAVKGNVESPLMQGSLWKVLPIKLNCRSGAGYQYRILRQFHQGEIVQADVGRGGADEVLLNAKDINGKPWMLTRSAQGKAYHCYVRANKAYIQPDRALRSAL